MDRWQTEKRMAYSNVAAATALAPCHYLYTELYIRKRKRLYGHVQTHWRRYSQIFYYFFYNNDKCAQRERGFIEASETNERPKKRREIYTIMRFICILGSRNRRQQQLQRPRPKPEKNIRHAEKFAQENSFLSSRCEKWKELRTNAARKSSSRFLWRMCKCSVIGIVDEINIIYFT